LQGFIWGLSYVIFDGTSRRSGIYWQRTGMISSFLFYHLNWVLFWLVWFSHKAVMNFHATPLLLQVSDILICNVPTADLEKDVSPCFFFACVVWWQALDIVPKKIHDRSPIFLGSYDDIEDIKNLYAACAKETF
jgi:hypothetical protein